MATVKGVLVVGVTIGAAVGVYYGLNKAFPKHVEAGEMPDITASADEVFSKTISENQPLPAPKAPPPTAPPTQVAQGEPAPAAGSAAPEPQPEAAKPAEPAPATSTPSQPASAPPEPAKPVSSSQQAMMVPEPAPAPTPKGQPAPAPETTVPAPAPQPAKPAPEPKPTPAPKPAPEKPAPTPAPKPTPPPAKAAPAPAPTTPSAPPATAAAPKKPTTPPATAAETTRWWGDPKTQDPNKLNLSYAGEAAGKKGIALLFTGTFASAGVANWIKVTDASGKAAPGHWELGASPKMLVFAGIQPGRYIVTLSPDLKDAQGKTLGRKLSGPVTVQ